MTIAEYNKEQIIASRSSQPQKSFEVFLQEELVKVCSDIIPPDTKIEVIRGSNVNRGKKLNLRLLGPTYTVDLGWFSTGLWVDKHLTLNTKALRQSVLDLLAKADDSARLASLVWQ